LVWSYLSSNQRFIALEKSMLTIAPSNLYLLLIIWQATKIIFYLQGSFVHFLTLVRLLLQSFASVPLYSYFTLVWIWTPTPHVTGHGVVDIHSLYLQPKWMKKSKLWKTISLFMLLTTNHLTDGYPRIDWDTKDVIRHCK
jgi:hypothetical protein